MEKCTYMNNEIHYFNNSWGSLRHGGFCGICHCGRTVKPYELNEALKKNECIAEKTLIDNLEYNSNPKNFKPRRF